MELDPIKLEALRIASSAPVMSYNGGGAEAIVKIAVEFEKFLRGEIDQSPQKATTADASASLQ